jgi:hypothetical protein
MQEQRNILWTGREYHSLENCLVNVNDHGAEVNSTIVGYYNHAIYRVDYRLRTNPDWQTTFLDLRYRHSNVQKTILLESDAMGNWRLNGQPADDFKDCLDVDIPVTPFTNTLPINRLKLLDHETAEIQVIYLDVLDERISKVRQKYLRLSKTKYHYENIPNDFEADIEVDDAGFVVDYPALFVRTAGLISNYGNIAL